MEDLYELITKGEIKKESIIAGAFNGQLDLDKVLERLDNSDLQLSASSIEDGVLTIEFIVDGKVQLVHFFIDNTYATELFRYLHYIPQDAIEELKDNQQSLFVEMHYSNDLLSSYLFQLKLLTIACPELILVIDNSAEVFLSKEWAFMTVRENLLPSPNYLFSIQAVVDEEDNIWMHTHGLNRCGLIELEVLGANRENFNHFNPVLETIATRLIDNGMVEKGEMLNLGYGIVVTWQPWEEEIDKYGSIIGTMDDRVGHDEPSGVIYAYPTPADYQDRKTYHLDTILENLINNPVYFISNSETERMSTMALSRFNHFKDAFARDDSDYSFLVKLGLDTDQDMAEEIGEREHLWFVVDSINKENNTVDATLINQPYGIKGLNEGDKIEEHINKLSDWIIQTPQGNITPDSVYMLFYI